MLALYVAQEMPVHPTPLGHQECLRCRAPPYREESQPSGHQPRRGCGSTSVRGCSPNCIRNPARFASSKRVPMNEAGLADYQETLHELASAFEVGAIACETPRTLFQAA